jgi:hypothetical protein
MYIASRRRSYCHLGKNRVMEIKRIIILIIWIETAFENVLLISEYLGYYLTADCMLF